MDRSITEISDSEWEDEYNKEDTPLENELEEGEIGEEEDEIYVVAEFEGKKKKFVNSCSHLPKEDIDERIIPHITFANPAHKVASHVAPKMSASFRKIPNERVVRVVNRDNNRRFNESSKSRNRRSISPVSNNFTRSSSVRPQMSGYSIRRQSILRSIHRRTRKVNRKLVSEKREDSQSYEDLLAEYQDIKFQLRTLNYEENNPESDCENSNEGSYGDKENRVYGNKDSSLPRNVEKSHDNKQCRKPSKISESLVQSSQSLPREKNDDDDDEVDALRKIALASKLNSVKSSKTVIAKVDPVTSPGLVLEQPEKKSLVDVEEDEDLLRAQLLSSLTLKQLDKSESNDQSPNLLEKVESSENSKAVNEVNSVTNFAYKFPSKLPLHKPLVINLKEDSDSEPESSSPSSQGLASLESIDDLLKSARTLSEASTKVVQNEKTNAGVRTAPLSVYKLPEIDVKEYERLKAEIANREQVKQNANPLQNASIVKKLNLTMPGKLKLAEAKFLKSNEKLINEEGDYLKLNRQLTLNEKSLKTTEMKIMGLEQQLNSAKKLELLQKQRVSELKTQKLNLEQKISSTKSDRLKFHRICLHIGKSILGTDYTIPNNLAKFKKTPLKILPPDKKIKSSLKKPKFRSTLVEQGQSSSKLANNLSIVFQKSLRRRTQELVSRLAELRKDTLKKSAIKSNISKNDAQQTDTQVPKRTRRLSLTKKLKKQKTVDTDLTPVFIQPSQQMPNTAIKVQKKLIIENTLKDSNLIFDFHQLFTNKVPSIILRDEKQAVNTYNGVVSGAFKPYRSSLIAFRSYRYSPYFRTKSNQCLSWTTYNHGLKPKVAVCQYDLTGKCNDDKCKWQHSINYTLSLEDCLKDLVHGNTNIPKDILKKLDGFVSNLLNNKDKMTLDEMCVLLVGRMNELLNIIPPHFITFNESSKCQSPLNSSPSTDYTFEMKFKDDREVINQKLSQELDPDFMRDESEARYFDIANGCVDLIQPLDDKGWISHAKRILYSENSDPVSRLDKALDIMSRALELNSKSSSLWSFYFSLYSKRKDCTDLTNLFIQALELTPSYDIWWQYLQNTKNYEEKEKICENVLHYCIESNVDQESKSHQLLEVSLYWIQLNVLTGHNERAIIIFEEILHRRQDKSLNGLDLLLLHINSKDRCLIWLCYISLVVFHCLPSVIFSAENSGLGKVIDKSSFVLPWHQVKSWPVSEEYIDGLVMEALQNCAVKNNPAIYNCELCLPLYKNLVALKLRKQRKLSAVEVGENLKKVPNFDYAWIVQACVYYRINNYENLRKMLDSGLSGNTTSPMLFSFAILFEIKENNLKVAASICKRYLSTVAGQPQLNLECDDEIESTFRQLLDFSQDDKTSIDLNVICKDLSSNAYVWLIYCMFLVIREKHLEAKEVFETAISRLSNRQDLEMMWLYYLDTFLSNSTSLSNLINLLNRCFNSVPNKVKLPGATGETTYAIYSYFNVVLDKYVSSLEDDIQILVYENLITLIPNNSFLAIRLLSLYLKQGKYPTAWRLCCSQLDRTPYNLDLWKIALQLAHKNKIHNNIRDVYIHATDALPYNKFLWKKFIDFEVSKGEKTFALELVKKCQVYGIILNFEA